MARGKSVVLALSISAAVVVALIIFIAADFSGIKNQLNSWKLLPEPQKLTELYFTNSNKLPTTYVPNQAQSVSFTTHNLEYSTYKYKYTIDEVNTSGGNIAVLSSGSFSLKQNGYRDITANPVIVGNNSRIRIVVKLSNINESIDYWVSEA